MLCFDIISFFLKSKKFKIYSKKKIAKAFTKIGI